MQVNSYKVDDLFHNFLIIDNKFTMLHSCRIGQPATDDSLFADSPLLIALRQSRTHLGSQRTRRPHRSSSLSHAQCSPCASSPWPSRRSERSWVSAAAPWSCYGPTSACDSHEQPCNKHPNQAQHALIATACPNL